MQRVAGRAKHKLPAELSLVGFFGGLLLAFGWGVFAVALLLRLDPAASWAIVLLLAAVICKAAQSWNRFISLLFLTSFTIFMVSRPLLAGALNLVDVTAARSLDASTWSVREHVYLVLALGLTGLWIGVGRDRQLPALPAPTRTDLDKSLGKISLAILFIFFPVRLYADWLALQSAQTSGYMESFSADGGLPSVIVHLSVLPSVAFLGYLASHPGKKATIAVSCLYVGEAGLRLLSGSRGGFIFATLTVIGYWGYRVYRDRQEWQLPRWLKLAAIPVGVGVVSLMAAVRLNRVGGYDPSAPVGIAETLYEQGGSVTIITYAYELADQIPNGRLYSLGPLYDLLINRWLGRLLGMPVLDGQTVEQALNGHYFAYLITYLKYPTEYLSGYGLGSAFLAELWSDGGYIAVLLGSILVGLTLGWLARGLGSKSWALRFVSLLLFHDILFMPRASLTEFLLSVIQIPTLLFVTLLIVISTLSRRTSPKNQPAQSLRLARPTTQGSLRTSRNLRTTR